MFVLADATVIDPVDGELPPVCLVVEGEEIVAVLPAGAELPAAPVHSLAGLHVLPGLVDLHTHVSYRDSNSPYEFDLVRNLPEVAVDGVRNAGVILEAGFTSARDCGSPPGVATAVRRSVDAGETRGPRLQVSGQILSGMGGMGDMHPSHLFEDNEYPTAMSRLVKDPYDARNAMRRQAKDGVDWFKVTLSGTAANPRVPAQRDDLAGDLFSEMVDQARVLGIRIIAHAESVDGAERAAAAGVGSIEHGVHLSDRAIEAMLAHDVTLVPTLAQYTTWAERGVELGRTPASVDGHRRVHDSHVDSVRRAHAAGVRIGVGGDAGGVHFPQGSAVHELHVLVSEVGMSPADALRAATVNGHQVLGTADRLGRIAVGMLADLLVVTGNPLRSPEALVPHPTAVLKGGRVVAGALPAPV